MSWSALLLVAVALGTDALSAALGIGMAGVGTRYLILLSGTVLGFHVLMPLIGVFLGSVLGNLVGGYAVWLGAGVLILLGLQMMREPFKSQAAVSPPRSAWGLIILSGSLSLDALSAGFGLGTLAAAQLPVIVITIGLVAGLMTAAGLLFGRYLGEKIGHWAGLLGGIILVLVGIHMVV